MIKYNLRKWTLRQNGVDVNQHGVKFDGVTKAELFQMVMKNQRTFRDEGFDIGNHDQHLFEMAYSDTDEAKFWLDIDEINVNISELNSLLVDLYNHIDITLNKILNKTGYLVYYKNVHDTDKIYSLRIINSHYKISMEQMEHLAKTLKQNTKNILCKCTDDRVYKKNRQICLPYNGKPYSDKYEKNNQLYKNLKNADAKKHLFVPLLGTQSRAAANYIISYVGNCKEKLVYINKIEIEKHNDAISRTKCDYSYRIKKLLDGDDIISTAIKYFDLDFYQPHNSKPWIKFVKLIKSMDCIATDDLTRFLEYSASVSAYTLQSNVEFCNRLTFNSPTECCLIKNYYNTSYSIVCAHLNIHQTKYNFEYNDFYSKFNSIAMWISNECNLEYDSVFAQFDKYSDYKAEMFKTRLKNMITITDKIYYNVVTGFLYDKDKIPVIKNYFVEKQIYPNYQREMSKNLENYDLVKDTLVDDNNNITIRAQLDNFMNYKYKTLVAEMKCGTGKSYHVCKPILANQFNNDNNSIIQQYINANNEDFDIFYDPNCDERLFDAVKNLKRNLFISPNNALNRKETQELLEMDGNCFTTHLDIQKLMCEPQSNRLKNKIKFYKNNLSMITSVQSIDYFKIDYYDPSLKQMVIDENSVDLVILDEFNTILNNFDIKASTFKGSKKIDDNNFITKMEANLEYLITVCKIAKRVLILDADINITKLNWFLNQIESTNNVFKIKIDYNKFSDYKIYIYEDESAFNQNKLVQNNSIVENVFISQNKAQDEFIAKIARCFDEECNLLDHYQNECIGLICGWGLNVFDCRDISKSKLSKRLFKTKNDDDLSDINVYESKLVIDKETNRHKLYTIATKYNINILENDEDIKNSFLDDYENSICNKYKFTDYSRTPVVMTGISLNSPYFDRLYFNIYTGVITVEEEQQMIWRSRNLKNKDIHIVFNRASFRNCRDYKDLEFIKTRLQNQANFGKVEDKYLINTLITNKLDSKIAQLITMNELDKHNSFTLHNQLFLDKLFYHGFKLDKNIVFIGKSDGFNNFASDQKTDRIEILKENFINTNIKDLDCKTVDYIAAKLSQQNLINPISEVARNKYSKYKKLNIFTQFDKVTQMYINKDLLNPDNQHNDILDNSIADGDIDSVAKLTKIKLHLEALNNDGYLQNIQSYLEQDFDININTMQFIDKYKFYNQHCSFITKMVQLTHLVRHIDANEITEMEIYDKTKDLISQTKYKKTKLLATLLRYLRIDLLANSKSIKRFIVNSDKSKLKISGFTNEILTSIIKIDGVHIDFLTWLTHIIKTDYNQDAQIPINLKKPLSPKNDFAVIKKVINHYLDEILLYFDYENQDNTSKARDGLQFVVKRQIEFRITNTPKINQYRFNNAPIITTTNNSSVETYPRNINNIVVTNQPKMQPPITIIYKDNINEIETINGNIILKPICNIKRDSATRKYKYNDEIIPYSELTYSFANQKKIRIFKDDSPKIDRINNINNYITRQTKISPKPQPIPALLKSITQTYTKYTFVPNSRCKNVSNLQKVKFDLYLRHYYKNLEISTIYNKMLIVQKLKSQIECPIIVIDKFKYINSYIAKIYQISKNPNSVFV